MTQREDKERNKTARECLGKFFYDLAKTCFLIMVAGNAVTIYSDGELKIFNITSIIIGLFLTWLFAYIANKVLIKNKIMGEGLTIIFSIILVPALGFAIWLRTPQGERFLKSLD